MKMLDKVLQKLADDPNDYVVRSPNRFLITRLHVNTVDEALLKVSESKRTIQQLY